MKYYYPLLVVSLMSLLVLAATESDHGTVVADKNAKQQQREATEREQDNVSNFAPFPRNQSARATAKKPIALYQSILRSHNKFCQPEADRKLFSQEALGFVTPWNSHGYTIAETFANKFDFIAPVWLQVRAGKSKTVAEDGSTKGDVAIVTGQHDIDSNWIQRIRDKACPAKEQAVCPRIVPRVNWEAGEIDEFALGRLTGQLLQLAQEHDFDGYVLELSGSARTIQWVQHLAVALHNRTSPWTNEPKVLIMVLPPGSPSEHGGWNPPLPAEIYKELSKYIHRFLVMTYDFSSSRGLPGPNAPIDWMEVVSRSLVGTNPHPSYAKQLLLGIPLYGRDAAEPVTGSQFIQLLQEQRPVVHLHQQAKEHYFRYDDEGGSHYVYYPTLYFLHKRLQLASKLNLGVALWELGQGLNYMYDLF